MGIVLGVNTVSRGLVFGFDTNYGVADNDTSTRFYAGEPTTNVLATTAFGYSGITLGSDTGGTYLQTNSATTGYNYIKVPNLTVTSNETYTWSFELNCTETITQSGNKYYFDTNEYSDQFSTSNDASRTGFTQIRPAALIADKWVKFSLSVTMKPNLTNAYSYDFLNFIKPHFTSKKIYYRNMQFENNKSHHTPFVNGTRSNTASLLDLTGNHTIDMQNCSFNANGQPDLDGTGDYLKTTTTHSITGDITLEAVFNEEGATAPHTTVICTDTGYRYGVKLMSYANYNRYGLWIGFGSTSHQAMVSETLNNDTTYHLVSSWNQGTGQVKIYLNGVLKSTQSTGQTSAVSLNEAKIVVGADYHGLAQAYGLNGQVYVGKIYDKVITDAEVLQNYKAYKNRFDI